MPPIQVPLRPCGPACFGPWLALLGTLLWAALPAAEEAARRHYDIPAGAAVVTLKRAAHQGGLEIVYSAAVVEGVQTQPVAGEFTPREALERMVAHTPLKLFPDPRTGALSIIRSADAPPRPSSQPQPKTKPKTNAMATKPRTLLTVLAAFTSGVLAAQTLPATSTKDDPVQLSPFVVNTETQQGWLANETLAGMRIRTDLKDAGAAIDVLTEQFLNDVGAVDMNQALKYVVNMQVSDFADTFNNAAWFSAPYLSRGIVGSTVMTDFFLNGSVPIDRYSTDNLTMLRGPNSILFGIGSPSGIVGASSKRAQMSQNLYSVRFMADTFQSARTELDVSRVVLRNRLAFRLAAVASDQHTDQKPSLNRRNSLYGTVTFKPFSRTLITVNAERGIYDRYFPANNLVADAYTPWVKAGKPTINFVTGKGMTGGSTTKGQFPTAVGSGLQNVSGGSYLTFIDGSNLPIMDWRNMGRGALWSEMVTAGNPGSGLILAADRGSMNNIPFTRDNTIIDLRAAPFGGFNTNDLVYSSRSVFIEQNLARDLDLELAWNQFNQDYIFHRNLGQGGAAVNVDPNEVLPNGAPNPYVGMPYIETGTGGSAPRRTREAREYTAKRATLSYKLDLDRHKIFRQFGFGNYRFAGLYQDSGNDQKLVASRYVNVTPLPGNPTATPLNQQVNRLNRRYYLQPGESSYRLFNHNQTPQAASVPGATVNGPIRFEERASDEAPRNNQQSTKSMVGAVQSSWWQAQPGYFRITALYGMRQDKQADRSQAFVRQASGEYAGPFTHFDNLDQYGTWGPLVGFTANTKTYNVTFRPISQLRLFYNFSDIFRASAANFFDVFGNPLRPTIGKTKDYGVKLDLWGERIFLTATKFETGIVDTPQDNTGAVRGPVNDIYNAISRPDLILERPFSYRNDISTGYEFSLNASLTNNWRARVTFGTQKTIPTAGFDDWVVYFGQNRASWQARATTPLLTPSAGYATVADAIAIADVRLRDARAVNGVQPRDQRMRNATFNTSYTFSEGRFKSVRLGGGFQWASRNVIGYARDSVGNLDTGKRFWGANRFSTDASIGYSRKIFRGKINWDVQVNVYNLLGTDPLLARLAVDDGSGKPNVVLRYTQTRQYAQLTNSFKF